MAQSHDARWDELVAELGGDEVRFLARDLEERVLFLWVPPASCSIVNDRESSEGEPRWMF